jgi:hypothetical protein
MSNSHARIASAVREVLFSLNHANANNHGMYPQICVEVAIPVCKTDTDPITHVPIRAVPVIASVVNSQVTRSKPE